ncbi:MAG TPA: hypothetical protein VHW70_11360 [Edaphobacter sp.]|nr:hypothetical protein [Edaphobacter sp.]
MKRRSLLVFMLLTLPALSQADRTWTLDQSTLTYHMSHPLHEVDGVSHAAKGKGVCHSGECDFLLAVAVKTFNSGDTNRDLHMLQVTRGAQFPIVSVRLRLPESSLASPTLDCDLEVQFAGNTAHYSHVPFTQVIDGTAHHITGTVPSTLSDFKIEPPSFFTVPIKNEIPVRVDAVWHPS